ncbi:MAG: NUDIX hydrolase [Chitinophagales bacterium]
MIDTFITKLKNRIELGLPGMEAQKRMAPAQRVIKEFKEMDYPDALKASVLVLFYPVQGVLHFVMIQRPAYDGTHGGQVSFPGGKIESTDSNPWAAALRETHEEIGVQPNNIQRIGSLSPVYIPPSNYFVHAFMGVSPAKPAFTLNAAEVESIIETPVRLLADNSIKSEMLFLRNNLQMTVPCYNIAGKQIWGATAIMLSELEELLKGVY